METSEHAPYPLSKGEKGDGVKGARPMITSNSSHTIEDTDSHEDESDFRTEDYNEVNSMAGKRIASNLELVPDYNDEVFCHCLRMLLDGIQDQIEEHRARLARRQEQQQQQAQLPGHDTDGRAGEDTSRHGSRRNDSECYPEEEDKGLCRIPSAPGNSGECEDSNAQISFPEGPLNVPLFRPLRRIESLASSLAFTSATDSKAFAVSWTRLFLQFNTRTSHQITRVLRLRVGALAQI
ncbi:hypothetical protein PC129_g7955 [Phytophthora cactorum]|nr:hypothetical protein PC129_g7955 [Phytophthora cactorum]